MKKLNLLLVFIALSITNLFSADHIVEVTGVGGAHTTISSAVAASVAGDRIIIYPNVTPFSENVTINKSLELTTAVEGERWRLTGSITINSGSLPTGSEVTVANGHLLNGNISTTQNLSGGGTINIVGCKINYGYIYFNNNGYFMNIANDSLMNGYVSIRNGFVLGNYISNQGHNASTLYIGPDSWTTSEDHLYISGNHILCGTSGSNRHGIYWASSYKYAHISNNFIERRSTTAQSGIYYLANKTGALENKIENNTITGTATNSWSIYIAAYNSVNKVHNNLIVGSSIDYGITTVAYNLNNQISYNYVEATIQAYGTNHLDDGTNVTSVINVIDADGLLTAGDAIDGGNPDAAFTDLDLSANDAGCYGGSLSKANFDAMTGLTGAKTFFLNAPRRVITGETIDILGIGFDH